MKWDEITDFSLEVCIGRCGGKVAIDSDDSGLLFDFDTDPNRAEIIEELAGSWALSPGNWIVTGTYCRDFHDENGQSSSEFNNVKWELVK